MAEYERSIQHQSKETAFQALNTIIQLHFEKTLEKKRAIDLQKKELYKLFQIFFIFLGLVFLVLAQRRCHKLTLGLATEKLRDIKIRIAAASAADADYDSVVADDEFEIHYQEPPETYFGKFKRNWALHFGFLILIYAFMISSSVVLLCF